MNFRPSTLQDLQAIQKLLEVQFATSAAESVFLRADVLFWKYWERRSDWSDPRSYVLENDGVLLAHAGLWPVLLPSSQSMLRGVHLIDWAGTRDAPGAGLTLVQKLAGMFDLMYAIGGSNAARRVLPAFGFADLTRQWRAVRPLRPLSQILAHQEKSWKSVPRLARNILWANKPLRSTGEWTARLLALGVLPPTVPYSGAVLPRSPEFFAYLQRSTAAAMSVYEVQRGSQPQGCFVLGLVRGQARLGGLWLNDPTPDNWALGLALATHAAKCLPGANEIVLAGSGDGPEQQLARQAGFRILPGAPVLLLDKKRQMQLSTDCQLQLADNDALFLDSGEASYWS